MQYEPKSEEVIYIDLPGTDGLKVKGILRGDITDPLVVMMHGRPGSGNALIQYLGARYLHARGLATLRLFMYDFEPGTRNLMDCTLETHVHDFEAVVAYLRALRKQPVFAVGHSYGGLTILASKAKLDGAVLWDPSHGLWWQENRDARFSDRFPQIVEGPYVIGTAGEGWVYPVAALDKDKQRGDTSALAAKGYPISIIAAGAGALVDLEERYFQAADEPKNLHVIADASHGFDDSDAVMLELFQETWHSLSKMLVATRRAQVSATTKT